MKPSARIDNLMRVANRVGNPAVRNSVKEHAGLLSFTPKEVKTVGVLADAFSRAFTRVPDGSLRDVLAAAAKISASSSLIEDLQAMPATWTNFNEARKHPGYQALVWSFRALGKHDYHTHLSTGLHESEMAEIMLANPQHLDKMLDNLGKDDIGDIRKACQQRNNAALTEALANHEPLKKWRNKDFFVVSLEILRIAAKTVALRMLSDGVTAFELKINPIKASLVPVQGGSNEEKIQAIAAPVIEASLKGLDDAIRTAQDELGIRVKTGNIKLLFSFHRGKKIKELGDLPISEAAAYLLKHLGGLTARYPDRIAGVDVSGREFGADEYSEDWGPVVAAVKRRPELVFAPHVGDTSFMAGRLAKLYRAGQYEQFALAHLGFFEHFLDLGPNRIGHAFVLEPAFLSAAWPLLMGPGHSLPSLEKFPAVAAKASSLTDRVRQEKIIIEHCPAAAISGEADHPESNMVNRYRDLPIHTWLNNGITVKLGTDGIWYSASRPRTLSEELVRVLLARPEAIGLGTALSLVG